MRSARVLLLCMSLLSGGCFLYQDEPHLWPGHDRWNVAATGYKAAKSDWTGSVDFRVVYDARGNPHQVAVLVNVEGLNPRDVIRDGKVIRSGPMPEAFFLQPPHGYLLQPREITERRVRVHGVLYTTIAGGAVRANGGSSPVFSSDPTTRESDELFSLISQVWPVIHVRRLEPLN